MRGRCPRRSAGNSDVPAGDDRHPDGAAGWHGAPALSGTRVAFGAAVQAQWGAVGMGCKDLLHGFCGTASSSVKCNAARSGATV